MKIAFLILAHKNPNHLLSLVRKLSHKNDTFFIHVDKKSEIKDFQDEFIDSEINIHFLKERYNIRWGGLEMVQATLKGIGAALKYELNFDHYILLSGADYPIQPASSIRLFYEENKHKSFIEFQPFPIESLRFGGMDRINCYSTSVFGKRETFLPQKWQNSLSWKGKSLNFALRMKFIGKSARKFPYNWQAYYGSQWWSLSHEAIQFIMSFLKTNPDYIAYHKYSLIPDEMFFQSILLNAYPNKELLINDNKRFIKFLKGSSHPKALQVEDLEEMLFSGKLFARKFEEESKIINLIDNNNATT